MSLLFMDGFDQYQSSVNTEVARVWTTVASNAYPSTAVLRRSGVGKSFYTNGSPSLRYVLPTPISTIIVGLARYYTGTRSSYAAGYGMVYLTDPAGADQLMVWIDGDDASIVVNRGSSEVGRSAAGAISWTTWHYIEVKVTIHDSTGSVVARVDGSVVLSLSGVDTKNTTYSTAGAVAFPAHIAGYDGYMDDVYILDTDGDAPFNDFLGPVFIDTLYPGGAGNYTQWSVNTGNNYAAVDDPGDQDDDTTYVYTDVDGEKDSYAFENLPADGGNPLAVMEVVIAKKDAAGPAQSITPFARISSTDYMGEETLVLPESYIGRWKIWETNPAGGAWDGTTIDNAEFGIQYNVTTTTSA